MNKGKWLKEEGREFLRRIGIREGQIVLDFGCGSGDYAIPAAQIVGEEGIVYALDKSGSALDKLMRKAGAEGVGNIERMETSGRLEIDLEEDSIDVVLLYDVLHHYYFLQAEDREKVLHEVHRVLKPDGFLSFYPGDPQVYHHSSELRRIEKQIEGANFHVESEHSETFVHEGMHVRGKVLNFRKQASR